MKWQKTDHDRIVPLALAGLLLAAPAHAADAPGQKQEKELLQRLTRSDAQAAAPRRRVEQLEIHREASRAGLTNAPMEPAAGRPAMLAQSSPQNTTQGPASTRPSSSTSGARSAPGAFEVDEEAAQRALERTLTQTGALLLPPRTIELTPSYTYRRSETSASVPAAYTPPGGGAPTTILVNQRTRRNENVARLDVRAGMPYNTQLEISLPYHYVRSQQVTDFGGASDSSGRGTGDLTLGVAKTLSREKGWQPDVIGRLSYGFGNGNRLDGGVGLNSGYPQLQVELVGIKRQDPLAFVGSVFFAKSFEDDGIRPGDVAGFSLSSVLAASPATSLQFGFSQVHRMEQKNGGTEIEGSEQTYGMFNIGASSVLSRDLTLVTQFGIGLGSDAPEYSFTISLPILLR
jgi:hypothetical protein